MFFGCSPCCGGGCLTTATLSASIADTVGLTPSPQQSPAQYNQPTLHIEAGDYPNGIDIPPMPHLATVHITAPVNTSPFEIDYDFFINSLAPGVFSGQRLFLAFSINRRKRFARGRIHSQVTQTLSNVQIPLAAGTVDIFGKTFALVWDDELSEWKDAGFIPQSVYAAPGKMLIRALSEMPGFVLHDFTTSNTDPDVATTYTWTKKYNDCYQPPLPPMIFDTRIRSQLGAKINNGDHSAVNWTVNYDFCYDTTEQNTRTFSVLPRWCETYRSTTTLISRNQTPVACHEIEGSYEKDGSVQYGKGIVLRQAIELVAATDNTNASRHPMAVVIAFDSFVCQSVQHVPPDTTPQELIEAMNCLPNNGYSIEQLNDAGKNNNNAFHAVFFYVPMPVYGTDALLEGNLTGGSVFNRNAPRFLRPMADFVNTSPPDSQTISTERYVLDVSLTNDQVRQIQNGGSVTLSLSGQDPLATTGRGFNLGSAVLRAIESEDNLDDLQAFIEAVDSVGGPVRPTFGDTIPANVPGSTVTVTELP